MKRLPLILSVAGMVLSLSAPPASAGSLAAVNQDGNFNVTVVQQAGGQTKVLTRQIKPRLYASTVTRLANNPPGPRATSFAARACGGGAAGNNVAVNQAGSGNGVVVEQKGTNNLAGLSQAGSKNVALVKQTGNNHAAFATQTGHKNIVVIDQRC
ncbi:MAG: curlin repeat-containing protein [Parvibaculum sp.]|uniref:curlin repeat-containing protein n=1 Tax=Parvibaculum sp. TaxID=2024848 RepID=UPI0027213D74|nr:curlin repeat-containing protein [Parvibaculum sp.]MDO8838617.1 curlin repeat-containing protein [Parvibaculum sp.]